MVAIEELTQLRRILVEKSMEGLTTEELVEHFKKIGLKKKNGKPYDGNTIVNYQSALRCMGFNLPRKNKILKKKKNNLKNLDILNQTAKETDKILLPLIPHKEVFPDIKTKKINNEEDEDFSLVCIKLRGAKNLMSILENF